MNINITINDDRINEQRMAYCEQLLGDIETKSPGTEAYTCFNIDDVKITDWWRVTEDSGLELVETTVEIKHLKRQE